MVAPRVRASGPGVGWCRGRRAAHRVTGRLAGLAAVGRPRHGRHPRQRGRQPQRRSSAAHPGLVQPADGPRVDRARGADHARYDGDLLMGIEYARSAARKRQPRTQHAVSGDDWARGEDRQRQEGGRTADHHVRHAATRAGRASADSARDAFERARREAARCPGRSDRAEGPVVSRLFDSICHRRNRRAQGRAGERRRRHSDRRRRRDLAGDLAGR